MNDYYVYRYIRLDTNVPFYIGKGRKNRAGNIAGHGKWCQNIAKKHGFEIEYIFEDLSEERAFDKEKEFIKFYREAGFELTNLTNGGDGASGCKPSAETRAKISAAGKGRLKTEEHKAKIGLSHLGKPAHNKGIIYGPCPEDRKLKISLANTGKIVSEETRVKLSKIRKGKPSSKKGKKYPHLTRKVQCIETGEVFESTEVLSKILGITKSTLSEKIKNQTKRRKTGLSYRYI